MNSNAVPSGSRKIESRSVNRPATSVFFKEDIDASCPKGVLCGLYASASIMKA